MNHFSQTFIIYIFILLFLPFYSQGLPTEVEKNKSKKEIHIDSLNDAGMKLAISLDSNAITVLEDAYNQAMKISYTKGASTAMLRSGVYFFNKSNLDKAEEYYMRSMDISLEEGDSSGIIKVMGNMSLIEAYRGNYEEALKNQLKVVWYYERKEPELLGGKLVDLAIIYYYLDQNDKLISSLKAGLANAEKYDNKSVIATATNNLGLFLKNMGRNEEALVYYYKSLDIVRELGNKVHEIQALMNIAGLLPPAEGIEKSNEALSIAWESGAREQEAKLLTNIGVQYTELENYTLATEYFMEAFNIHTDLKMLRNQMEVAIKLAHNLERQQKYPEAIKYWQIHYDLRDSLYKDEMIHKVAELETKYETKKKETEIIQNQLDLQLKEATINEKNKVITIGSSIFALALITALLFYQRYRGIQKMKLQMALLDEKERGFRSVIMAQEKERQRIASELHDSVGQQLNVVKMAFEKFSSNFFQDGNENESAKISSSLNKSIEEVRSISHQMMPRSLMENGLVDSINDLLINLEYSTNITYEFEPYNKEEKLPDEIEITLYRITQELISNVLKHADASKIHVMLHKTEKAVHMLIEDNGKGFKGDKENGGIGFLNIKNRIEMLKGKIDVGSDENQGTFVNVVIPLK